MKFRWGRIFAATAVVVCIAMILPDETVTEINAATGTSRSRRTFAGFVKGAWKESPTWVSQRAASLGIATNDQWRLLSTRRHVGITYSLGCGKAPVSYDLKYVPENAVPEEQRDAFVRQFAAATEKEREEILRRVF
ncbi:MAG TPA: hypothetical protein VGE67_05800 [Haloferula sp.]